MNKQNNKITTIKLEEETKSRLDKLKVHDKESYNNVIKKMLFILNALRKNSKVAEGILNNIDEARTKIQTLENQEKSG
jgi:predicted DNA-binding protein